MKTFKFIFTLYDKAGFTEVTYTTIINAATYEIAKVKLLKLINYRDYRLIQGEEIKE